MSSIKWERFSFRSRHIGMQLHELHPGQHATITHIHAEQALSQRLHALGFRPGKAILVLRQAAFDGPLHVRIGSTDVIIRLHDAQAIHLRADSAHAN